MYLSKLNEDVVAVDQQHAHPIKRLYPALLRELADGGEQMQALWGSISPAGNIYRMKALERASHIHSEDLWRQLRNIAEWHKAILPGDCAEDRAQALYQSLKKTVCKVPAGDTETGMQRTEGYLPLTEFLDIKVQRFGPVLVPVEGGRLVNQVESTGMALVIFLLQICAPIFVVVNRWQDESNPLRRGFAELSHELTWSQTTCLGTTLVEKLCTIAGTPLVYIVINLVREYVRGELDSAKKWSQLPRSFMWQLLDVSANVLVSLGLAFSIPLLFFSEDSMTSILLDSLSMIFLLSIDDLSSNLCLALGFGDENFSKSVAWNAVLLSQCPVHLSDVMVPYGTPVREPRDLWRIEFNAQGALLKHNGQESETRLRYHAFGYKGMSYCVGPSSPRVPLNVGVFTFILTVVDWILLIESMLFPALFFVFSHAC